MLLLNSQQVGALEAIKRERDIQSLSAALTEAFPEAVARLADRYGALIDLGVQRAAGQGLDHAVCVGRYLACWFMLGAAFETRTEFAWARDLLATPGRAQGSKVFQLCRRTRETLAGLAAQAGPGGNDSGHFSPAAFDQALAGLDAALMPRGVLGSLLPASPVALGEACDVDALDLRLLEPAPGRQQHQYRLEQDQWRRLPTGTPRPAVTLAAGAVAAAGQPAAGLPPRLHLLSQPPGGESARLRLRTRAVHCCDPQVHPLVTCKGPRGLAEWRGTPAADVLLNLFAGPTPAPASDAPQPAIGLPSAPQLSLLELSSCGLRESGQPIGDQQSLLAVYPAEQHWMIWRREAGAAQAWPDDGAAPPPAPPALYRIERDGLPLDASRWQAGLQDLDRQLAESLARLATAWERESGVTQGRMQASPAVMTGSAGITWGWSEGPGGMVDAPWFRLAGALDLIACQLDLRLGGELSLHGASSRLALHCAGRQTLRCSFGRQAPETDMLAALEPAQLAFRQPFVLQIESLARADGAALLDADGPVAGALVGHCGLRPARSGAGLQWFCELGIEAVSVALRLQDPLRGGMRLRRPLLPAMRLLDWSLG